MATSFIGTGEPETPTKNIASNSISEDAKTKELQRTVPNKSDGTEIFTTANPGVVSLPAATVTTLTPPAAITGFATQTTLASIKDTDGIKKITDALPAGDNNIGNVDIASAIPAGANVIGAIKRDVVNYTPFNAYKSGTGAQTDDIVYSPTSGKKIAITDITMSLSAAGTVTLEWDKTGGDAVVMAWDFAANGGVSLNLQSPFMSGENDADLVITNSAGNYKISVSGYEY